MLVRCRQVAIHAFPALLQPPAGDPVTVIIEINGVDPQRQILGRRFPLGYFGGTVACQTAFPRKLYIVMAMTIGARLGAVAAMGPYRVRRGERR